MPASELIDATDAFWTLNHLELLLNSSLLLLPSLFPSSLFPPSPFPLPSSPFHIPPSTSIHPHPHPSTSIHPHPSTSIPARLDSTRPQPRAFQAIPLFFLISFKFFPLLNPLPVLIPSSSESSPLAMAMAANGWLVGWFHGGGGINWNGI